MAATAALKRGLPKANKDVILMDVLLYERLRESASFATSWRGASRVEQRKGRPPESRDEPRTIDRRDR